MNYDPERDIFNSVERRLHAVVDVAIENLAAVQPVEVVQSVDPVQRLPQGVVSLDLYREQRNETVIGVQQEAIEQSRRDAEEARNAA